MIDKSIKYTPIRKKYAPVVEIPEDIRAILEKEVVALRNNDSYLVELLLQNPAEVQVGTYTKQDGLVHLSKEVFWCWVAREGGLRVKKKQLTRRVSEISMMSAVLRFQQRLKELPLTYMVWSECRNGSATEKKMEDVPFLIGLVDRNFPIKEGGV